MNNDIVVKDITKIYKISHTPNLTLREKVESYIAKGLFLKKNNEGSKISNAESESFLALDNVSFEVQKGDRLAVIGQNGAGKSTLLKILSRITEPTSGTIKIRGRVASLLEVGTGFHPELTGRENIFLNGAILGMPKSEIQKKFDQIVDFSEVEYFLDTPVKFYSSGMYVKLAFAVAANLDPEVLILDEVLAVGDIRFQQKCLDRMRYASNEGRTVLFVSHNVQSVNQICPKSVLLNNGKVKSIGPTPDVVKDYLALSFVDDMDSKGVDVSVFSSSDSKNDTLVLGDNYAKLVDGRVLDVNGVASSVHSFGDAITIEMTYEIMNANNLNFVPNIHIYNAENILVFITAPQNEFITNYTNGTYTVSCTIPKYLLNDGVFRVTLALSSWNENLIIHFAVPNTLTFRVEDNLVDDGYRNGFKGNIPGIIRPRIDWSMKATI